MTDNEGQPDKPPAGLDQQLMYFICSCSVLHYSGDDHSSYEITEYRCVFILLLFSLPHWLTIPMVPRFSQFPEHLIFAGLSVHHHKNWFIRSIPNLGTILINKIRCNIVLCALLTERFYRYKILQEKCKIKKTISMYFTILRYGKTTITRFQWWNTSVQVVRNQSSVGEQCGNDKYVRCREKSKFN
jgi:hypothetical protein